MVKWSRRRTSVTTSVDVDLDDFDEGQLLQALINAGRLTEDEAAEINNRHSTGKRLSFLTGVPGEFSEAQWHLSNGRIGEARIHLERFLGREWSGVLSS